jgi:hypothetical protein
MSLNSVTREYSSEVAYNDKSRCDAQRMLGRRGSDLYVPPLSVHSEHKVQRAGISNAPTAARGSPVSRTHQRVLEAARMPIDGMVMRPHGA